MLTCMWPPSKLNAVQKCSPYTLLPSLRGLLNHACRPYNLQIDSNNSSVVICVTSCRCTTPTHLENVPIRSSLIAKHSRQSAPCISILCILSLLIVSFVCSLIHRGRFDAIPSSYSQCLFNPPSYTLATDSCHILGLTKDGIGAPEYCCEAGGRFEFGSACNSGRIGISCAPETASFRGVA